MQLLPLAERVFMATAPAISMEVLFGLFSSTAIVSIVDGDGGDDKIFLEVIELTTQKAIPPINTLIRIKKKNDLFLNVNSNRLG